MWVWMQFLSLFFTIFSLPIILNMKEKFLTVKTYEYYVYDSKLN
jgi:hypothetical protein